MKPREDPYRLRLRAFLESSSADHSIVLLDGVLTLADALGEFAALAAAQRRVPVVVGPPMPGLDGVHVVPEAHLRRPTEFVGRLDRVMAHHLRPGATPFLAFAPSEAYIEPWSDVEALLDTRGADGFPRMCMPAREAMRSLGNGSAGLLSRRHKATLQF